MWIRRLVIVCKKQKWKLKFCAAYIVDPSKGQEESNIEDSLIGSQISIKELPMSFFSPLFSKDPDKYPLSVAFVPDDGNQTNEIRSKIRHIVFDKPSEKEEATRKLALRLASATDKRSQSGLFVVLTGKMKDSSRVLLWKFPADESLRALPKENSIGIELIKDAFSKRNTYYKAAMFEGSAANTSFWQGKVEDNQAKRSVGEAAEFWIEDFLMARFELTDTHGTRILSRALKQVIKKTKSLETKEKIVAAALVLRSQIGKITSLEDIATNYLPVEVRTDFLELAGSKEIAQQMFHLERQTLTSQLRFKSIVLDGEFTLRGPLENFDNKVTMTPTDNVDEVRICLEGKITSRSIRTR